MNRPALRYLFIAVTFGFIPILFNNCQGGLFGSKGFSAARAQCVSGLYKGELAKLNDGSFPGPFSQRKVRLGADVADIAGHNKVSAPVLVPAGAHLPVTFSNSCLLQSNPIGSITSAVLLNQAPFAELERQVYLWTTDKEYSESEIEALVAQESCILGVAWNRTYHQEGFNDPSSLYQPYLQSLRSDQAFPLFYNSGGGMDRAGTALAMVAVIDTGVDWPHPDLQANMWTHSLGVGIDITTLGGTVSYNPLDVSSIGHGTHVAGSIAAVTDNAVGISGAMPFRAKIMPIKLFLADGSTTSQHLANALRFAHQNGADVINLSIGNITDGPNSDPTVDAAVQEAVNAGVTVVTVTGNADGGANGREINLTNLTVIPGVYASRAGVIGVGSYETSTGNKSFFSHYSTVYGEIAAPGAEQGVNGLYSTIPRALGNYGRLAGTSQAAPLVSAAAALTIGLIRQAYNVRPTPADVERLILSSAVKDPKFNGLFKDGNRLDLYNLVQRINSEYPATRSNGSGSIDLSSVACPQ